MHHLGLNLSHYVLFLLLFCVSNVISSRHFSIIDDRLGDSAAPGAPSPIRYSPSGAWTSQPGSCPGCRLNPNQTERIMNGTWHDTTHLANGDSMSIELTFTGTFVSPGDSDLPNCVSEKVSPYLSFAFSPPSRRRRSSTTTWTSSWTGVL